MFATKTLTETGKHTSNGINRRSRGHALFALAAKGMPCTSGTTCEVTSTNPIEQGHLHGDAAWVEGTQYASLVPDVFGIVPQCRSCNRAQGSGKMQLNVAGLQRAAEWFAHVARVEASVAHLSNVEVWKLARE